MANKKIELTNIGLNPTIVLSHDMIWGCDIKIGDDVYEKVGFQVSYCYPYCILGDDDFRNDFPCIDTVRNIMENTNICEMILDVFNEKYPGENFTKENIIVADEENYEYEDMWLYDDEDDEDDEEKN
jgi:hypothetical protein